MSTHDFRITTNKSHQRLTQEYRLTNEEIEILCYADDDAVIMAESEDDLQSSMYSFSQKSEGVNLETSGVQINRWQQSNGASYDIQLST